MDNLQGRFQSQGGQEIFYRCWLPDRSRAVVLLAHGLAEHGGRYEEFARFLAGNGIATYANDHPGHGLSGGKRGHIDRFDDFADALAQTLSIAEAAHPGLPFVLFGHSMGGLIAAHFLLRRQSSFAAAVLTGPAIRSPQQPSPIAMFVVRLLAAVMPRFGARKLDASGISRDARVVAAYEKDPLVYRGKGSAGLAVALIDAMRNVIVGAATIDLPILIMHGSEDRLTAVSGSQLLHDSVSSAQRKLVVYDGLYHEILNEPERERVMRDILDWLEPHLG